MGYNKITLQGRQICDYLYIESAPASGQTFDASRFEYVDSEPTSWNAKTLLFAKFNKDLVAGNSSLITKISGYEVRRQTNGESHTEYVGRIPETDGENKKFMIDYMVKNNNSYTYYLYPSSDASNASGSVLSPSVTEEVSTDWGYWTLMLVD